MTLQQALKLRLGQTVYHKDLKNADGSAQRFRVNGKVRTWKRDASRVEIPYKRGLWEYGYFTASNLEEFDVEEPK